MIQIHSSVYPNLADATSRMHAVRSQTAPTVCLDAAIDQFEMFGSCNSVNIEDIAIFSGNIVSQHSADAKV